jgi:hypothetical protein
MAITAATSEACSKRRRAVCGSQFVEDVGSNAHRARSDMVSAFAEPLASSGAPARPPGGARAQPSRRRLADSGKEIVAGPVKPWKVTPPPTKSLAKSTERATGSKGYLFQPKVDLSVLQQVVLECVPQ